MKSLNELDWKKFSIGDIFEIKSGVRLTKDCMTDGDIPFIGSTDANNGITSFCGNSNKSLDSNVLGVNYNGSVVENFYHPYQALFSDDVKRLHLKHCEGNKYIYLFIKKTILNQKRKYQYGYKFNGERMKKQFIILPVTPEGKPDYLYMEEYMKTIERKLLIRYRNSIIKKTKSRNRNSNNLNSLKWKEFEIKDIFPIIQRGKRLKTDNHLKGLMPYVSSSAINNGVDNFIGNKDNVRIFDNCISIANSGSVGASFYHPYLFVASDHITKLQNFELNKSSYLFLATMTQRLAEKYGYNREINESRIMRERVFLPVTSEGLPNFSFMEKFMRSIENRMLKNYIDKRLSSL